MLAGVDVFRVNFSHTGNLGSRERVEMIRELNKELSRNTGILADLQGPKLGIGVMEDDIEVTQVIVLPLKQARSLSVTSRQFT